jgi:hypothetical protein
MVFASIVVLFFDSLTQIACRPISAELSLNDNALSGTIPDQLANLESLVTLSIGNNDLTGQLPRNVCRLRNLEVISVDCEAQGCQCCTECAEEVGQPTGAPVTTLAPTRAPTVPPTESTDSPTECVDTIRAFSPCFAPWDDIDLSFESCYPEDDDWVGIYPSTVDPSSLPNPPIWSWACGNRSCRQAVSSQQMALNEFHASSNAWPLDEGQYVLVLVRNSAQPYTAFAVSSEFTIQRTC